MRESVILLALAAAIPHLTLAAAMPEVPTSEVQVVREGEVYVLRNLVDDNPLYTYARDEPGKSNCTDACAIAWQPLRAPESAKPIGQWTVVKRHDGSNQWAYDGKPVYSFARDPEDGVWHLLPTFPAQ